jgi:hypothetical protein
MLRPIKATLVHLSLSQNSMWKVGSCVVLSFSRVSTQPNILGRHIGNNDPTSIATVAQSKMLKTYKE